MLGPEGFEPFQLSRVNRGTPVVPNISQCLLEHSPQQLCPGAPCLSGSVFTEGYFPGGGCCQLLSKTPDGSVGKESTCNAGDTGDTDSIPGSGRASGEENGDPLQYSCLENSMERGAWRATQFMGSQTQTRLSE